MKDLQSSIICTSELNCKDCRNQEGGRYWRLTLAQVYRLPEDKVDFECPHGKPWGFVEKDFERKSETSIRTKLNNDSSNGEAVEEEDVAGSSESRKERHYVLPPEVREKLRDVFLQFRTACYQHRSLHGCTCELQTTGNCGLKTALKNTGRLPCAKGHFPTVKIDEDFRKSLNECDNEE